MADAIIAQTETEYEIRVSRGAVRFIVRAANINDAVVKAQRVVNTWQFKVFREHERLVVRRIENGRGPPTPAQRAKLFDDYAALIRERDRLEASLKVDSLSDEERGRVSDRLALLARDEHLIQYSL